MHVTDFALAHRLEARDAWENAQSIAAYDRLYPHVGGFASPVGGGYALYAGSDSPLTQAMGMGMNGPVGEHELDQMEALYRGHGAAVQIELCSLADPSLHALLTERGYQVVERSHVLFRPLRSFDVNVPMPADVHVRVPAPDEADVWAYTVAAGFAGSGAIPPPHMDLFLSFFHLPDATCFLASVGGQAAGGGVVSTAQGTAALFAASTRPEFRNRGVQSALLRARLACGAAARCDVAMVVTEPGTISQRNAERLGFQVAYGRAKYCKT